MEKLKKKFKQTRSIWVPLLIGLLVLYILYMILTNKDIKNAYNVAQNTVSYIKTSCIRYNNNIVGNQVKNQVLLLGKAKGLSRHMTTDELLSKETLDTYISEQIITGVVVFDKNIQAINVCDDNAYNIISSIRENINITNIIKDKSKSYMDRIEIEDSIYEYAVVSRLDDDGLIVCYNDVTNSIETDGELTINTLLKDNNFNMNGTVIISDGEKIISANDEKYMSIDINDCFITMDSVVNWKENEFTLLTHNSKTYYGVKKAYKNYYIYAVFAKKDIFANRQVIMAYALILYIIFIFMVNIIKNNLAKRNMSHIQKQYRIINAISSLYTSSFSIHIIKDEWEAIKLGKYVKSYLQGVKSADEMLKDLSDNIIDEKFRKGYLSFTNRHTLSERLRGKKAIGYTYQTTEGNWLYSLIIPQRTDDKGNLLTVMLVSRDISEDKQKEIDYQEQLQRTAQEAERANISKTDFLRRMSHDIRTPINGIRGMVEIARHNIDNPEKQAECLDKIWKASGFLLDLVNDVLDMNKLESGNIVLEYVPFDLNEILDETKTIIEAQAIEFGIKFTMQKLDLTHSKLIGSPLHIRQVLQNIMSNAIKYNTSGGKVDVTCRELSYQNDIALIEIVCSDTGLGMSEDFKKRAFEPFMQEHADTRTELKGTGLGLAITKELVTIMNGSIDFTSIKDVGTTFVIKIPFKVDKQSEIDIKQKQIDNVSLAGTKVLLVEDNELNMEIAEFLLSNKNMIVTKAWNGKEAVDIFSQSKVGEYDIILMDIMMPVMNGCEAALAIRELNREDAKTVPIFAMTANAFSDDIQRSKEAGMNEHLSKPLDAEKIMETIRMYIKK